MNRDSTPPFVLSPANCRAAVVGRLATRPLAGLSRFRRQLFPLANREPEVLAHSAKVWRHLNQHVHASNHLMGRLIGEAGLHVFDNFDEEWADETLRVAADVFDMVWFAVFDRYPRAFDR